MSPAAYYDAHGVLGQLLPEDVVIHLEEELRSDVIAGRRKRKLRNVTLKLDPLCLQSIKKIATRQGVPYQTVVRQWLTEKIRKELRIA
jgi:predicted DNA binding CopG/RHH family protein